MWSGPPVDLYLGALSPWPVLTSLFYICILSKNQCVLGPSVGLYLGALTSLNLHMHLIKMRSGAPQLACTLEPWHVLTSLLDATASSFVTADVFLYRVAQKSWHDTKWHQRKWPELIYLLVIWLEGYSRSSEMAQLDLTCSLMMYLFFDARINGSRNIKTFLLQTSFYRYYLMIYMFSLQFLYFYTVCFIVQWILWYLLLFLAICWRCSSVAICVSAESLRATHSSRCWCGCFDWIRYFSHVSSPSLSFFLLSTGHYAVEHTVADLWTMLFSCLFIADKCKATGMKTRLDKVKVVASALYSVTMVLWKETAFPLSRAMKSWKRNVVSLLHFSYCVSSSFLFTLIFFVWSIALDYSLLSQFNCAPCGIKMNVV